jgi:hypothetical protein
MLVSAIQESFSQTISFEEHTICTDFTLGTELFACDINQDGLMDFVACHGTDDGEVSWWENNGYNEFIKHVVDDDLGYTRSVCAGDLNEDGNIDILAACWGENSIYWYENDGDENWIKHYVDNNFTGPHTVDIKDVDNDGNLDVLCSSFDNSSANSEIAWWRNEADTNWTKQLISTRFQQSPFIFGEDMDGDDDLDILACGELNGEVYWWENDGNQGWTEHEIDSHFDMAHTVFIRDVDLDGDMDVCGAACMSSKVAWWENDGSQSFTKHNMGTFIGALWFDVADLDNDGDRDFYGGGQGENHLAWWENDGGSYTRHDLEDNFTQTFAVVHADFDNDNDTDLVAVGYNSNQIGWFENNLNIPNLYTKPECVVYDEIFNRYIVANIGNGSLVETDTSNNSDYWVHGYDILYGMCIADGILYTSDGDTLFGFHLVTGEEVFAMKITNYNNLDGMTTDGNGYLYVIDTWGRILKVDLENETYEELVNQGLPQWPQDCVFDPFRNMIVVAAYEANAPIVGVDIESGEITTLSTLSVGRYDGITIDQYGNFYLGSHSGSGKVYKYPHDFSDRTLLTYGQGEVTGLHYNQQDDILAIPSFDKDTVFFIHVIQTGMDTPNANEVFDVEIFPNPAREKFGVRSLDFVLDDKGAEPAETIKIELLDVSGKSKSTLFEGALNQDQLMFETGSHSPGLYFLRISSKKKAVIKKIIIQ